MLSLSFVSYPAYISYIALGWTFLDASYLSSNLFYSGFCSVYTCAERVWFLVTPSSIRLSFPRLLRCLPCRMVPFVFGLKWCLCLKKKSKVFVSYFVCRVLSGGSSCVPYPTSPCQVMDIEAVGWCMAGKYEISRSIRSDAVHLMLRGWLQYIHIVNQGCRGALRAISQVCPRFGACTLFSSINLPSHSMPILVAQHPCHSLASRLLFFSHPFSSILHLGSIAHPLSDLHVRTRRRAAQPIPFTSI